ncbi:RrF2 family transcriptional regulator [Jejuia pallidilutea]|uniref:BadM/Rrf2 family transcriptional regulator n=1 Tax=Jejuia pallidilutea TaxID=504487 RepID=A0A098LNM9_9FLAO|nr:Rrf2 family transcriptional regulator [Jejuia pallidilutea]PQV48420.1 BadM/Rrf2 family transcriptional regulator [Jejuia pallidilutea]GAL88119.1 iron-sulfur cluster regulator IscR [Jejuia pallidilutea]
MLSNSSKYAVKAVLFLALHSNEDCKIMVKDISEPINVPQAYIAKLLQELSRANIISSTRGPKGGFYLSETNKAQPIINILKVIDGEKRLTSCMLSLDMCNEKKPCPLHNILSTSRTTILENLRKKTIKELSEDVKKGNSFLPL